MKPLTSRCLVIAMRVDPREGGEIKLDSELPLRIGH
jgi:hypothetical protein